MCLSSARQEAGDKPAPMLRTLGFLGHNATNCWFPSTMSAWDPNNVVIPEPAPVSSADASTK
jgi:hypothetical protein